MKIQRLYLKKYNQFKEVEIDLTYPKGHKKEGQPLDKVCIIGEGGTGKTSLLRLLKFFISRNISIGLNKKIQFEVTDYIECDFIDSTFSFQGYIEKGLLYRQNMMSEGKTINIETYKNLRAEYERKTKPYLVNYPTDSINTDAGEVSTESNNISVKKKEEQINNLTLHAVIDFAQIDRKRIWEYILKKITQHRAKELDLKKRIGEIALSEKSNSGEIDVATDDYKKWIKKNPSPLLQLAEAADFVLERFGLKVKTDLDYDGIISLSEIQLQTLSNNKTVERDFLSTGTRQIIDTLIPLIELKPKNAFILFDEPERSLYPTLQTMIIGEYEKYVDNCQMFFATHSPMIASSFDPWEIIELKFDENHQYVYVDKNYEGERNVDNYIFHPSYLRWDEILTRVFELKEEGNSAREKELMNAIMLQKKLEKAKKDGKNNTPEFEKLLKDYMISSKKVGWTLNEKN